MNANRSKQKVNKVEAAEMQQEMATTAANGAGRRAISATARAALGCVLVVAMTMLAGRVLWWATADGVFARPPGPGRLDALLGAAAGVGACALLGWLALSVVLTTVASLARSARLSRAARAVTPAVVRHLVAVVMGVSLVTLPQLPARADDRAVVSGGHCAADTTDAADAAKSLDRPAPQAAAPPDDNLRRWVPDRPAAADKAADTTTVTVVTGRSRAERVVHDEVAVRRGDTLWAIVARHLGPEASDADIAAEWPRWFAANRTTIGADPDLIRPGQLLAVPTAGSVSAGSVSATTEEIP